MTSEWETDGVRVFHPGVFTIFLLHTVTDDMTTETPHTDTRLQDLIQLHVVSYSLSSKSQAFMLRPRLAKLCNSLYIKHIVNRHNRLLQPSAGSWGRASSVRWGRPVGVIVWSYLAIMPKSVAKVLTVAVRSGDWEFWDLLTLTDNERQYRHDGLTGVDAACLLCVLSISDPLLTIHLHAVCWQRCQSCTHQMPRQLLPDYEHHTSGLLALTDDVSPDLTHHLKW